MGTKTPRYSEEFKKNIVSLAENGKSYAQLQNEYGVSSSAVAEWKKKYSTVTLDDSTVLTSKQIDQLRRRNAVLEEENLILKKASESQRISR